LDTHILIRVLAEPKRLTSGQARTINTSVQRGEPLSICAISLLEIALLSVDGKLKASLEDIFDTVQTNPAFRLLPLTCEIAAEFAALHSFRDPSDRAIVATARVHGLKLVTSDERIIESNLVPVID
jgi:PIN domain nuclease of toxin-antitoxin system